MTRIFWHSTALLNVFLGLAMPVALTAADEYSTGAQTWEFNDDRDLSTRDWPLQSLLKLTIDLLARDFAEKNVARKGKEGSPATAPNQSTSSLPELKYGSDRNFVAMGTIKPDKGDTRAPLIFMTDRSVRFDAQKHALRILDVINNNTNAEQPLKLTFTTRWQPEIVPNLAKYRYLLPKQGKSTGGVLVTTKGDAKLPVLMFVFGNDDKGWKRTEIATPEKVGWAYEGWLAPHQRIVVLHWLALIDDVRSVTLRKTRAALIQQGMPNDDSLGPEVFKELINYPMEPETEPDESDDPALALHRLHFVNDICDSLKIERSPDKDQMALNGGPVLMGEFVASGLLLKTPHGEEKPLDIDDIAAIQGGAGIGRKTRVYLRDGTVLGGALSWKDAAFDDPLLGSVKLNSDSLDTLIMRSTERDQQPVRFAGLWVTQDGDVRGLTTLPEQTAHLRWTGGDLPLSWPEVISIHQLPEPELGHEVVLKDGSRIHGWLTPAAAASCLAYATSWTDLTTVLAGKTPPKKSSALSLQTEEGSVIAGTWGQDSLTLATAGSDLRVPTAEIRSLTIIHAKAAAPNLVEIKTSSGPTLQGQPVQGTLPWNWSEKTLRLPWSQISQITMSEPGPAPAKP